MQQLILLDEHISVGFSTFIASHGVLAKFFIAFGVGLVYLAPLLLIYVWFVYSRKIALRSVIAGLIAWEGLSKLIAKLVNRARPSESLIGAKELVFHRPDTSFPSDHSAFLMALTVSFYLSGQRKLGHFMLLLTVLVGVARVGIGVHFPLDVFAGWAIGALAAYLIKVIEQPLDQYIIEPIIGLARKLRL